LTKESENLINKEFFNSLQKKPIIINISRGKIINEDDLISALSNNLISGCALDVFEEEPISKDNKLKKYDNVVFSSHNASNTIEANTSVNNQVTKTLLKWLEDVH
jgi:phosphoglycerate dehydrogenase-like enzyme